MTPKRLKSRLPPLLYAFLLAVAAPAAAEERDLSAIIRAVEKQYWSASSHGTMRMEVVTKNWKRSMVMEAWSRGDDEFLVRILEPAKDKGVSTLKRGNEIWNYLPKVDRTIKIPSSLMGDSWMGSHLTNDDLVKESRVEADYTFRLLEEKVQADGPIIVIEALPRAEAAVVWGKIVYSIHQKNLIPVRTVYYDEDGVAVREMRFTDLKNFSGRRLPATVTIVPLDAPEEKTALVYQDLTFDVRLDDGFFSLGNLRRP